MHRFRPLLCLLLALVSAAVVRAETTPGYDPHRVDGRLVGNTLNINEAWLINPANDPSFAQPDLDDRGWTVADPKKPLVAYGIAHVNHIWYRTHVKVNPDEKHLGVLIEQVSGSYRVFANGRLLGGIGSMEGDGQVIADMSNVYSIPDDVIATGDLTIAVHFVNGKVDLFDNGRYQGFNPESKVLFGAESSLWQTRSVSFSEGIIDQACNLTLMAVVILLAAGLSILVRGDPVYPAIALTVLANSLCLCVMVYMRGHDVALATPVDMLRELFNALWYIAQLEFVRILAGVRRSRWFSMGEPLIFLPAIARCLETTPSFPFLVGFWIELIVQYGLVLAILWLVGVAVARRNPEARIIGLPVALFWLVTGYAPLNYALLLLHVNRHLPELPPLTILNWHTSVPSLLAYAVVISLLIVLILRTMRIVRERTMAAREIEAAQTMQQLLLARASQPTPGFAVESVYHPASEVGGDFFLVSPGGDGSLVAIVGDVSGKGLVAAMRVSMILGVLRREQSRRPGEVLHALNEALMTQSDTGFTTACCVRLDRDGRFVVANAGHIAPYVGGNEVDTSPSLPLGLAPDQEYLETEGELHSGQRMVLMSDGVVEARAQDGELYGFERLKDLTRSAAQQIADAAKTFGQEDDITVLTIACGA